jgi:FAD/FMN-containing dehydrogenase
MSNMHPELLKRLHAAVGDAGLVSDEEAKAPYETDWLKKWSGRSSIVVRPADTAQTAEVMRVCHETHTPVVTQGGNTGMSGGATPDGSGAQVVLSTVRMNAIRAVDPLNNTLTAEAGVLLAHIQAAAQEADRFFPLSLGSEGSCTIGGNLATNAGGIAVLRYGNARELALGLEVVLPDGRVWNGMRALRKDNTGYDLRDLFIGSEGTLGVITAAVLKLFRAPWRAPPPGSVPRTSTRWCNCSRNCARPAANGWWPSRCSRRSRLRSSSSTWPTPARRWLRPMRSMR